jgi:hypothetical protein
LTCHPRPLIDEVAPSLRSGKFRFRGNSYLVEGRRRINGREYLILERLGNQGRLKIAPPASLLERAAVKVSSPGFAPRRNRWDKQDRRRAQVAGHSLGYHLVSRWKLQMVDKQSVGSNFHGTSDGTATPRCKCHLPGRIAGAARMLPKLSKRLAGCLCEYDNERETNRADFLCLATQLLEVLSIAFVSTLAMNRRLRA